MPMTLHPIRGAAPGLLAALTLTLVLGCGEAPTKLTTPPPPPVTTAHPEQRAVTPVKRAVGRVAAEQSVDVRARVRGFLREIQYQPGDIVEAGQVLFRIEPEEFEASVAAASAALEKARVSADRTRITLERTQSARESGAATEIELLQATAEHAGANAAVLEAQAALDAAELNLSYTIVAAPIAGRVAENTADIGDLVGVGDATLLTTIVSDARVHVYFQATEREVLRYLKESDVTRDGSARGNVPVSLELSDGSRYDQIGVIDYLDPELDRATGTITLRSLFDNPKGLLVPGMVVRAVIEQDPIQSILIPESAVLRDLAGPYIYIIDDANTAHRTSLSLGDRFDGQIAVLTGLDPSDRIIVEGAQRVRDGLTVAPTTPDGQSG